MSQCHSERSEESLFMRSFAALRMTEGEWMTEWARMTGRDRLRKLEMEKGYIHLYYGDGKGKTTAAMGLAARALGHGKKVVVVQFLKKGTSGEISSLKKLGAATYTGKAGDSFKVSGMSEEERKETEMISNDNLYAAISHDCDVLVLDEICAALENDMVDVDLVIDALAKAKKGTEIIITGRKPPQWLIDQADYITEMRCERHPHTMGIKAREGIEY